MHRVAFLSRDPFGGFAGAGSAEGISFTSVLLELVAITFSGAYGFSNKFPFNAYGESVFLAIQTGLIALLVLSYTRGKLQALVFAAIYSGNLGKR